MINNKYHHGKLKEAIISEAFTQLKMHGSENISFRSIARVIGVASSAPYNHFSSKEKLLNELINIGKIDLFEILESATNRGQSATEKLLFVSKAYLNFSIDKKDIYELMFSVNNIEYDRLCQEIIIIFQGIVKVKLKEGNRKRITSLGAAITAWSMIHGFSIILSKKNLKKGNLEKIPIDFEVQKVFNEMAAIWGKGVS